MRRECLWCGVTDCRDSCEQCGLFYCSPNHRSLHLSDGGGGGDCCPFRIEERPGKGRCMIATKDIKPQELIVRDTPLVIGPSRQTEGVSCTACYASMTGEKLKRCLKCNFPLCGLCGKEKLRWHEQFECRNLVCEVPDNNRGLLCEQISSLLLYRFILRSRLGELPVMFACPGEITLSPDDLNTLRFLSGKIAACAKEEIASALRILYSNAKSLECEGGSGGGTGLYARYSMVNHSCVANAKCSVSYEDYTLELRAAGLIREGEEITTRYLCFNTEQPTRALRLWDHWGFVCGCSRCSDPTELSSYNSAVRCFQCESGHLLPSNCAASKWKCDSCEAECGRRKISDVIVKARQYIKNNTSRNRDLRLLRTMVQKLESFLHPSHSIILQVKYLIIVILSAAKTPVICNDMERWQTIVSLVEEQLQILSKLDPGPVKNKGTLLKFYCKALRLAAASEAGEGQLDTIKSRSILAAKELCECFRFELVKQRQL